MGDGVTSLKDCLKRYIKPVSALMVISIFLVSLYLPVFYFSQISNNPLTNLPTNYLLNLIINPPQTNNDNPSVSPLDWQLGNGTIEVIERVGGNYYTYNDNWQYKYIDGKIQIRIIHPLKQINADYLLVGYKDGWNVNETLITGGTTCPYPYDFISLRVQAGGDDWMCNSSSWDKTQTSVCFGVDNSGIVCRAGFRWLLSIPAGARIISSTVTIKAEDYSNSVVFTQIRLYDQDNCISPTSNPWSWPTTGDIIWTLNNYLDPWIPGNEYTSPDITPLVQSFIDRPGYAPGKYIGLRFGFDEGLCYMPGHMLGHRAVYAYEGTPNESAKLDIEYEDPNYRNYYWIQPSSSNIIITFEVDQTFTYNGIK